MGGFSALITRDIYVPQAAEIIAFRICASACPSVARDQLHQLGWQKSHRNNAVHEIVGCPTLLLIFGCEKDFEREAGGGDLS
jgi:hypothetical protein